MIMVAAGRGELTVHVEGIGWWSPGIADWNHAAALLQSGATLPASGGGKPTPAILPLNERRRAPMPVLLACEVASQACAMAQCEPATLPCVFTSMFGDSAITDELCATLASAPLDVSPTRFHNSVHNAPVGHWTVAAQSHASSSAVSAGHGSFAAGLLESALFASIDGMPVLFAAYDIAAQGALTDVLDNTMPFAVALLLHPHKSAHSIATLRIRHRAGAAHLTPIAPNHAAFVAAAPIANGLPLLSALACASVCDVILPNGASSSLAIEVRA